MLLSSPCVNYAVSFSCIRVRQLIVQIENRIHYATRFVKASNMIIVHCRAGAQLIGLRGFAAQFSLSLKVLSLSGSLSTSGLFLAALAVELAISGSLRARERTFASVLIALCTGNYRYTVA